VVANASIALVSAERLLDFACHFLGVVVLSQVVTLGGSPGLDPWRQCDPQPAAALLPLCKRPATGCGHLERVMSAPRRDVTMYAHLAAQLVEIRIEEQQARAAGRRRKARPRPIPSGGRS
jgi:hypothetical protein